MITIKMASHWRSCNVCHSRQNVCEILFKSGNQGTEVALCDRCRDYLAELIASMKELTADEECL